MKERILIGTGKQILEVPAQAWRNHLANTREHTAQRLSFMTDDHQVILLAVLLVLVLLTVLFLVHAHLGGMPMLVQSTESILD